MSEMQGYVGHAAENRNQTVWLFLLYIIAFELMAIFPCNLLLLLFDPAHIILVNPLGYFLKYTIPVAMFAGIIFWILYNGHAASIIRSLQVNKVDLSDERRFVTIAQQQCTALGVREPSFGVIEVSALNALTVGEGPSKGLIAVTRGLLNELDDDELAGVLAHEASHIRNGDTKVLAANHALKRTAMIMQTQSGVRIQGWRALITILILPVIFVVMMMIRLNIILSKQLTIYAERALKLSRDHIADGDAVRITHYPQALISALQKISGRSRFTFDGRFDGLLFDCRTDNGHDVNSNINERIASITRLSGAMMAGIRPRTDTRAPIMSARIGFGKRVALSYMMQPPKPLKDLKRTPGQIIEMLLEDRAAFARWNAYCWEMENEQGFMGIDPKLMAPVAGIMMFLFIFHWPSDGDFTKMFRMFNPMFLMNLGAA
jgi:heat shock protein HtpX